MLKFKLGLDELLFCDECTCPIDENSDRIAFVEEQTMGNYIICSRCATTYEPDNV